MNELAKNGPGIGAHVGVFLGGGQKWMPDPPHGTRNHFVHKSFCTNKSLGLRPIIVTLPESLLWLKSQSLIMTRRNLAAGIKGAEDFGYKYGKQII